MYSYLFEFLKVGNVSAEKGLFVSYNPLKPEHV